MSKVSYMKVGEIHLYVNVEDENEVILSLKVPDEGKWRKEGTYSQYKNKGPRQHWFKEAL